MERYQDRNLDRSWNRKSRGQELVNLSGGCWNDYASNFFCCVFQFMIQILNRSWDWSCLSHVNIAGLGGAVVQSTKTAFHGFCRFKGKPGCCSLTEQECSSGNNTRCPHSSFHSQEAVRAKGWEGPGVWYNSLLSSFLLWRPTYQDRGSQNPAAFRAGTQGLAKLSCSIIVF